MNITDALCQQIFEVMGNEHISDEVKTEKMEKIERYISNAYEKGHTTLLPIPLLTSNDLFNVTDLKRMCFPDDIDDDNVINLIW